jgi:hypothetical protein
MKATFIPRCSLLLLSLLIILNSFAQKAEYKNEPASPSSSSEISNVSSYPGNNIVSGPETANINKKVLKHFNRKFDNATSVKWEEAEDNFLATFLTGETLNTSLFDKKGRIIYAINYGSEKELPSDLKNIITNKYINYTITSVTKVLQDNRQIRIVKLADKCNYVTVRVEDDEMEEIENFQKAN